MQRHTASLNFHPDVALAAGEARNRQSIVCKSTSRVRGERCALRIPCTPVEMQHISR
ncbi:uncharacterized protein TrAtP1_001600 [Trichoderma atroviride]|uniref:uncharacterized protein n=1 Tax=Hypocrea atroviridis TaxID=63577 RepID=UPI00331C5BC0|nr:hypothetical protein TrAtP1_001600 [Trichoderma atroviride]